MNDTPHAQPPPATNLQALALSEAEANALLDRLRERSARPTLAIGLLGWSARRTCQFALLAAAVALAEVALIAGLSDIGKPEPLERALGTTLLEGRPLTARDVYLLHLWGKP
jgi:hypothetical protein